MGFDIMFPTPKADLIDNVIVYDGLVMLKW